MTQAAVETIRPSQEHFCNIERGAGADIIKMLIEPFSRGLAPGVAQPAEQAPFRVEMRSRSELRHQAVIADPVHEHAAVLGLIELAIVDQSGGKGDRTHFPHQR